MKTITSVFWAFVITFAQGAIAEQVAEQPAKLQDLMSAEEINAMGLDGLSDQQQRELVEWIMQFQSGEDVPAQPAPAATAVVEAPAPATTPAATPAVTTAPTASTSVASAPTATPAAATNPQPGTGTDQDTANFGKAPEQPDEMRSRIPGTFTGWTGDTRFVLENGQVWEQRYETRWKTEMENPEVVIKRRLLGLHRMEIIGTGKSVPVKRIK